jgi:hypothetical protein
MKKTDTGSIPASWSLFFCCFCVGLWLYAFEEEMKNWFCLSGYIVILGFLFLTYYNLVLMPNNGGSGQGALLIIS